MFDNEIDWVTGLEVLLDPPRGASAANDSRHVYIQGRARAESRNKIAGKASVQNYEECL